MKVQDRAAGDPMADEESGEAGSDERVSTFRVLARQPLSLDIGSAGTHELDIQGVSCRISVKPAHSDLAKRKELGGTTLAIEFLSDPDLDLVEAARAGFELIEDFLSAITVVSGTTFGPSELLQVARLDEADGQNCEFMIFMPLPLKHWHEEIWGDKLKIRTWSSGTLGRARIRTSSPPRCAAVPFGRRERRRHRRLPGGLHRPRGS
jgi:hypothetical protein